MVLEHHKGLDLVNNCMCSCDFSFSMPRSSKAKQLRSYNLFENTAPEKDQSMLFACKHV